MPPIPPNCRPSPARTGPGRWQSDFAVHNMGMLAQSYQCRAAGSPTGKGYYLGPVQFDGYRAGKLIEAKHYLDDGRFIRDPIYQYRKAWELVRQAQRQAKAAATAGNVPIEWRVAGAKAAAMLRQMMSAHGLPVSVVHWP